MAMTTPSSKLDRHLTSLNTAQVAGAVGDHASGRVNMTIRTAAGLLGFSMHDKEIEVPAGFPPLDRALSATADGATIYLTRDGHSVAALVPAAVAKSILQEFPVEDDEDDHPEPPTDRGERTLDDLWREQGVQPVTDPAELRGEAFPDFDQFFAAVTAGRP